MDKHWTPCPRCDSKKVKPLSKWGIFMVLIGTGSCLLWAGIIFFPLWIFAALFILVSPVGFIMPLAYKCDDCNHSWAITKNKK